MALIRWEFRIEKENQKMNLIMEENPEKQQRVEEERERDEEEKEKEREREEKRKEVANKDAQKEDKYQT
jgi:hypothetical protein